jgi:hypothetical protein
MRMLAALFVVGMAPGCGGANELTGTHGDAQHPTAKKSVTADRSRARLCKEWKRAALAEQPLECLTREQRAGIAVARRADARAAAKALHARTCIHERAALLGCITRASFGYGPLEWEVSDYCGQHIAGNHERLWMYEGFHQVVHADRHGIAWRYRGYRTLTATPTATQRWNIRTSSGLLVAWTSGPDGPAGLLAYAASSAKCLRK